MKTTLINNSEIAMPRLWMQKWLKALEGEIVQHKSVLKATHLTVVFLDPVAARKINKQFRKRNYATDVLSFQSGEPASQLGELLLCPSVLQQQAKDHNHSFKAELGYMLIHGVLHLLGYDHENATSARRAKEMYRLQDQVFDRLRAKFHL